MTRWNAPSPARAITWREIAGTGDFDGDGDDDIVWRHQKGCRSRFGRWKDNAYAGECNLGITRFKLGTGRKALAISMLTEMTTSAPSSTRRARSRSGRLRTMRMVAVTNQPDAPPTGEVGAIDDFDSDGDDDILWRQDGMAEFSPAKMGEREFCRGARFRRDRQRLADQGDPGVRPAVVDRLMATSHS